MATAGWRATTGVSPSWMAGELERCLLIVLLYLILIIILILIKPVYNEHNRVAYTDNFEIMYQTCYIYDTYMLPYMSVISVNTIWYVYVRQEYVEECTNKM